MMNVIIIMFQNPAPGLQTFKTPPKYLESDLEFHLCPLPR